MLFDHHWIVHNIHFLWKESVRNSLFRFFDLQSKGTAISYCLSQSAIRVITQLMEGRDGASVARRKNEERAVDSSIDNLDQGREQKAEELLARLVEELEGRVRRSVARSSPAWHHMGMGAACSNLARVHAFLTAPSSPEPVRSPTGPT